MVGHVVRPLDTTCYHVHHQTRCVEIVYHAPIPLASMTFLTCTAFLVGTRIAVSRAPTHGGAIETACTCVKNLVR